jgi:hypothetical protein
MILGSTRVKWDKKALGVPINQEDLVGTLTVFTVAVIRSLDEMGVTCTVQDRDAYLHLWLVIGDLLGIDYKLLFREERPSDEQPLTYADMQLLARIILDRHAQASPEGQELMTALLQVEEGSMPRALKGLPRAMTRRLIGNEQADLLGVPRAGPMGLVTSVLRPFNALVSPYVRRNVLGVLAGNVTRHAYQWWITKGHGDRPTWRFEESRPAWLDAAHTRVRRRAGEYARSLPLLPVPAKVRISGFVSPD